MAMRALDIQPFIKRQGSAVLVRVVTVKGSTPRDVDALMLVGPSAEIGTIGGGQLEFVAIDTARQMLRQGIAVRDLDVPLGPEIGQCCGGRVQLALQYLENEDVLSVVREMEAVESLQPHIYVFGAGHVGRALALALAPLPFAIHLIDTRQKVLGDLPDVINAKQVAMPETVVRAAPEGSAFVAVTHDHALDFLITREALMRGDADYVGMIGSQSKKAQFRNWFLDEGGLPAQFSQLICPIGAQNNVSKLPEIIAALVVAEIINKIGVEDCPQGAKSARLTPMRIADGK